MIFTSKKQNPDEIKKVAMDLDNALERMNIDEILPFFTDDCSVQLLDVKLSGKEGVKKWLLWMFKNVAAIKLVPIVIMVEDDVFFEEFIVQAKLHDGSDATSKQAEVLIYEDYKIKDLRLYFDRLDFANAVAKDPISKGIVRKLIKKSLKGLV
ncbi:MAG: nuclear transport factor 2 family protein [Asgard group archaeon]|nr:nuclear transport factor 2 family protein [Asgard group archaeon]